MKLTHALLLTIPLAALAVTDAHDAAACGGCFVPTEESTQVTGHRMMLSISQQETTLWDQITYTGEPSSFAWVLPTKGIVEVGLSSDALFAFVEQATATTVLAPPLNCPPPPSGCYNNRGGDETNASLDSAGADPAGKSEGGGVTVVAEATVGPYETVQLMADDPTALHTWLAMHNYNVPADIDPVIDAYVKEKFNFLALKLVPGQGIAAMRPVRISSQGASPVLPLRMVAAGTGAVTPITLWVLGEGRYEPANFETIKLNTAAVIRNWSDSSSNLAVVKKAALAASGGLGWLTEAARPTSAAELTSNLIQVAQFNPTASGYGDAMGMGAQEEAQADSDKLVKNLDPASLWITRVHAELTREAFGKDLELQASASQTSVSNVIETVLATGKAPACPVYNCGGISPGGGFFGGNVSSGSKKGSAGCAIGRGEASSSALAGLGVLAALALLRRRRDAR